jgi:hypothetical protein
MARPEGSGHASMLGFRRLIIAKFLAAHLVVPAFAGFCSGY